MGSEGALWNTLKGRLDAVRGSHARRIEDSLDSGVPDVSWAALGAEGWLELKYREDWPKRRSTPVRFPHLTEDQVLWLADRGRAGGNAKYLIQVTREYFLFDWGIGPALYGGLTRDGFYAYALAFWPTFLPEGAELVGELARNPTGT